MTLVDAIWNVHDALQDDLENGVKWLNENAAKEFHTKYPHLSSALTELFNQCRDGGMLCNCMQAWVDAEGDQRG